MLPRYESMTPCSFGREHAIALFMRHHMAREQKRLEKGNPWTPFPPSPASRTWYQNRQNKGVVLSSQDAPKGQPPNTPPNNPPSLNTAQQLLRLRQLAARHLVHRLPLAGRGSSPEGPQPNPLLPGHNAVEGEVPLKGRDGARRLCHLTQGVGGTVERTVGELREERREVALGATDPLFCLRVSNFPYGLIWGRLC